MYECVICAWCASAVFFTCVVISRPGRTELMKNARPHSDAAADGRCVMLLSIKNCIIKERRVQTPNRAFRN